MADAEKECFNWELTVVMRRRFEDEGNLRARRRVVVVVEVVIEAMVYVVL
jgi:hypothetical protein